MKKAVIVFLIWLLGAIIAYPIDKYAYKLCRHQEWPDLYSMDRWDTGDRAWCIVRSTLSWADVGDECIFYMDM